MRGLWVHGYMGVWPLEDMATWGPVRPPFSVKMDMGTWGPALPTRPILLMLNDPLLGASVVCVVFVVLGCYVCVVCECYA